jgi:hypothetical protein
VQEAFAAACGRGEDKAIVQSNGEIACGAWGVAEAVNPSAKADELPAKIQLGGRERRFEIGAVDVDGLLRQILSHWVADLLMGWSKSFLRFLPTMSEALKR